MYRYIYIYIYIYLNIYRFLIINCLVISFMYKAKKKVSYLVFLSKYSPNLKRLKNKTDKKYFLQYIQKVIKDIVNDRKNKEKLSGGSYPGDSPP